MWRFALLCSVVTLTVACTDGPGAPTANTDEVSLVLEGDPPPPPLDGRGFVSLSGPGGGEEITAATEIVPQQDCFPPNFFFSIEGDYFRNKTERMARIHFVPDVPSGSGSGTIQETLNDLGDASASGTLVVIGTDLQHYEIHLEDYRGTSLLAGDETVGTIAGTLDAEVMACGERTQYTGTINFAWSPFSEEGF